MIHHTTVQVPGEGSLCSFLPPIPSLPAFDYPGYPYLPPTTPVNAHTFSHTRMVYPLSKPSRLEPDRYSPFRDDVKIPTQAKTLAADNQVVALLEIY